MSGSIDRARAWLRGFSCVIAIVALTGCSTPKAPELPPDAQPPPDWSTAASNASPIAWTADFGDGRMASLVRRALENNPDLAAVAARFRQAEARAMLSGADRFPLVDSEANVSRRQSAGESRTGAFRPGRRDNFDLGLNVSWEIDLWGRLRDRHRAAQSDAAAAEADLRAGRLSLAANVAKGWLNLIETERQVELARQTRKTFGDALAAIERKFERGLQGEAAGLDVSLSRANLAASEANLEARQRERDAAVRTLETLLGKYPDARNVSPRALPTIRRRIPAGLPSSLLLRRPDILAVERRHAAAVRRVSVAKKSLLPQVRLTGSGGYTSTEFNQLLDPTQLVWNIGSGLAQPVFEGGRIRGEIALTKAERDEIAADYAGTAIEAFREVETALAAERYLDAQVSALRQAVENSRAAEKLALDRYDRGQVDIITVLESQRRAFEGESSLIRAENARLQNRIDLHLALGGDFE